jgi:hypothetical protein
MLPSECWLITAAAIGKAPSKAASSAVAMYGCAPGFALGRVLAGPGSRFAAAGMTTRPTCAKLIPGIIVSGKLLMDDG